MEFILMKQLEALLAMIMKIRRYPTRNALTVKQEQHFLVFRKNIETIIAFPFFMPKEFHEKYCIKKTVRPLPNNKKKVVKQLLTYADMLHAEKYWLKMTKADRSHRKKK